MVLGIASIGASLLGGALGKKGQKAAESKTGFQALPSEVQTFLLDTFLPKVQELGEQPFRSVPMMRASNPANDPFASQALWELQNYSDVTGGLFSPLGQSITPQPQAPVEPEQQGFGDQQLAQQYMSLLGTDPLGTGYVPHRALNTLQTGISQGRYGLDDIGQALGDQGYGTEQFTPNINFNLLAQTLGGL